MWEGKSLPLSITIPMSVGSNLHYTMRSQGQRFCGIDANQILAPMAA